MSVLLYIVALFNLLASVLIATGARGAIHEATAAILWVGGWLILAAGVVLARMKAT